MGAVRLIAARCKARRRTVSPRRYSVDLPDYTTRVRGGRKADLTSRMHFWSRIRHLDPIFLVSFRASPVASVVRGSFFVKQ